MEKLVFFFLGMAIATFLIALALNIYYDNQDRGVRQDELKKRG